MPRWVPYDLHVGLSYSRQHLNPILRVVRNGWSHATALRGERHLHKHATVAVGQRLKRKVIHQTKVYDVNGNFRVVHVPELIPHHFFGDWTLVRFRRSGRGSGILMRLAKGIGVAPGNAVEISLRRESDRVRVSQ